MKKCLYCNAVTKENRDSAVEGGWTFVDIRAPVRKYLIACPNCFDKLKAEITAVTKGRMSIKWS